MRSFESIKKALKGRLTAERLDHSLRVGELAAQLSPIYGENPEQAYLAGLLHDIAKELELPAIKQMLNGSNGQLDPDYCDGLYLHAPAGAIVAEKEFGIKEPRFLEAVRYHTGLYFLGEASLLTQTLCIADYVENMHPLPQKGWVMRLALDGKLDSAMHQWCMSVMRYYLSKGLSIHPNLVASWLYFGRRGPAQLP